MGRSVLEVEWSEEIEARFASAKIFLKYPWVTTLQDRIGKTISIPKGVSAEPYSNMPAAGFSSLGMFSYNRTDDKDGEFTTGRYCSIAPNVQLSGQQHPTDRISTHPFTTHQHMQDLAKSDFGVDFPIWPHQFTDKPPKIGNDVWIGRGALLKRGITIGDGAIIGERSVVTKDVPPYAVVAGAPATIKRYRFPEQTIERMLAVRWWRFKFTDFAGLDPTDPLAFVEGVAEREAAGIVTEMPEKRINLADLAASIV